MAIRTFHVEFTFTRVVEVKINDECDLDDDEDIEDVAQEIALERAFQSNATIDEDYQCETVKEVTKESA